MFCLILSPVFIYTECFILKRTYNYRVGFKYTILKGYSPFEDTGCLREVITNDSLYIVWHLAGTSVISCTNHWRNRKHTIQVQTKKNLINMCARKSTPCIRLHIWNLHIRLKTQLKQCFLFTLQERLAILWLIYVITSNYEWTNFLWDFQTLWKIRSPEITNNSVQTWTGLCFSSLFFLLKLILTQSSDFSTIWGCQSSSGGFPWPLVPLITQPCLVSGLWTTVGALRLLK